MDARDAAPERPAPTRAGRGDRGVLIAVGVMVVVVLLFAFEVVLYEVALIAFSHLDSPACAGSNTFCSPDGRPGPTGGAIVVAVGNAAALVAAGIAATALRVRRRARAVAVARPHP